MPAALMMGRGRGLFFAMMVMLPAGATGYVRESVGMSGMPDSPGPVNGGIGPTLQNSRGSTGRMRRDAAETVPSTRSRDPGRRRPVCIAARYEPGEIRGRCPPDLRLTIRDAADRMITEMAGIDLVPGKPGLDLTTAKAGIEAEFSGHDATGRLSAF